MSRQKIVIIGAGIGGIATANILAKAGYDVHVYEKNDQPGGRAGLLEKDGFRFDTGPSWYLMPEVFEHYFELFGKDINKELRLTRLSPAYKVFFERANPITVLSDLEKDADTFEAVEHGAGTQLKKYVKLGEKTYRLALRHFLYSNFSSVRDLTHSDIIKRSHTMLRLAATPIDKYVRSFVHDQRLKQILEYPMVFLGTSPFNAPALYSLMSALDFKEGVFYPQGGLYKVIERLIALSKELGVTYHYDTAVTSIMSQQGKATGITVAGGAHVAADIIISNADLHFTETRLLQAKDRSYPDAYWRTKEAGPSALLCYLGVKGTLPELEHHNLFFVDDWKQNFDAIYKTKSVPKPASIYVCKPSASDSMVAPKHHENVFVLVPLPPDISLSDTEVRQLADTYIEQIAIFANVPDLKKRIVSKTLFGPNDFATKFNAWQSTALGPSHVLRQSAFFRTRNKSKKVSNLYYVGGATMPGIGLPMCLISAELVYKRLAGESRGGQVNKITQIGNKNA